ncbi:hypothetical protein GF374_00260, partial [Candidatus Woesearchaeota archaeon]|nr:hypothetical protein [Candidatus Woesearchaeota archaeon]
MATKKILLLVIVIVLGLFMLNTASAIANVTDCTNLSTANEYYTLNVSINSWGTDCISIDNSNITLDCKGYTIGYGGAAGNYRGIDNEAGHNNITIKNCVIIQNSTGAGAPGPDQDAISFADNVHSYIYNNTITTYLSSKAIRFDTSNITNITLNTINTTGENGTAIILHNTTGVVYSNNITTEERMGYGIYLGSSKNVNITSNIINTSGSLGVGIYSYSSNTIRIINNTINTYNDYGDGIYLSIAAHNQIIDNTFNTSKGFGIWIYAANKTHYNHTVQSNTEQGDNIYYLFGNKSALISSVTAGQIIAAFTYNTTFNNITADKDGIMLLSTDNVTVQN